MKKVVLAIVILVIIVTGGVLEDFYIHKTFSSLNEKLVSLENSIKTQNDDCIDKANEIFDWWEKKRMYMELFAFFARCSFVLRRTCRNTRLDRM